MFYFLALGSMLGYSVQQTLLVHHARRIDGLSLAFYRNVSFFITLLPLLIGASVQDVREVIDHWMLLMSSGLGGAVYLALTFSSYKFLPVGLGTSISRALSTITIAIFGWVLLGESLSTQSIAVIAVILVGTVLLGVQHTHLPHLDNRFALGILLIVLASVPVAYLSYTLAVLSREINPFVGGYVWETSIGVACLLLLLLRSACGGKRIQRISMRTFLIIAACSAPTLIGTGLMALAILYGPIGIANAIGSGLLVVATLLAWILYSEKLHAGQWASMALILGGIVALKFV